MRSELLALAVCGAVSLALGGCSSQDVACSTPFDCELAPGFVWADPEGTSYETVWNPGSRHPAIANIRASATPRNWMPDPGFVWASDNPASLMVRWGPGSRSQTHPNMRAGELVGQWVPDPGYKLVNASNPGLQLVGSQSMRAVWNPGSSHPQYARTFASPREGQWEIEAGYVRSGLYGAQWQAGIVHPNHPNVVSGNLRGRWVPASGYEFASATGLEVVPAQTYLFGRTKEEADERFGRFLVGLTTVAIAGSLSQSQEDDGFVASAIGRPAARVIRDEAARDVYRTLTD